MDSSPVSFLVFDLHGSVYGVRSANVREIIWLPELTPVEEAPPYIAGVFNLRNRIVPVMDLNVRLGHQYRRYQICNSVIVLEAEGSLTGVIVDEALDVYEIAITDIEDPHFFTHGTTAPHFIEGEAKSGGKIIMILDAAMLAKHLAPLTETGQTSTPLQAGDGVAAFSQRPVFCPEATPRERELFRERAKNLSLKDEGDGLSGLLPMAVVGISGEYFGFDVGFVREFTDIHLPTPVPCCPPHIVGNMNLRGNIVTIVDIRNLLALPAVGAALSKAVITDMGESLVGLAVGEVLDVAYFKRDEIVSAPAGGVADKYVKGTASFGGRLMTVLDMGKIFSEGELVVNEET